MACLAKLHLPVLRVEQVLLVRGAEEDAVGDDRVGEPPGGESEARPQRGAGGRCRRSLEVRVSDGPPEEGPGLALRRSKRTQKTPEREIERQRARQKRLRKQLKAISRSTLRGFPGRPRGRAPRDPKGDPDSKVCKLTIACGDIRQRGQHSPGTRASTPVNPGWLTRRLQLPDAGTQCELP